MESILNICKLFYFHIFIYCILLFKTYADPYSVPDIILSFGLQYLTKLTKISALREVIFEHARW